MKKTLSIGQNLIQLDAVDSTNNYAKLLLSNAAPDEGTVIMANEQTAGRGQAGNTWYSQAGKNLTVSLILYPDFLDADKQFYLNMAMALAVKDFCESVLSDDVKIKWPNDIYYANNKLGGMLIENTINGGKIATSIIGIGLNVNQVEFDENLPNPISLAMVSTLNFNLQDLSARLCQHLQKYYQQLQQLHFNFLDKGYTDSLYRYQQTHEFKKGEQIFKGEINGVTKEGKLLIHSGGRELKFAFKEVEYVL
jgi:BirA family biotin operon repressor/biotin-[acetyl-CoA-carboxylase] ligase